MEDKTDQEQQPEKKEAEVQEKNIFEDLLGDLINLDRGLPATILAMIKSPSTVIDSYFANKKLYVNPFRYTIFILAITTAITALFVDYNEMMKAAMEYGAQSSNSNLEESSQAIKEQTGFDMDEFMEVMQEFSVKMITKFNQLLYIVVLAPILAFCSRLFFKKRKPKFKHHYVMYLYMLTTFAVFSLLFIPFMKMEVSVGMFTLIVFLLTLCFSIYVQKNYLGLTGFKSYVLMILSYTLGYILYTLATALIQLIGSLIIYLT